MSVSGNYLDEQNLRSATLSISENMSCSGPQLRTVRGRTEELELWSATGGILVNGMGTFSCLNGWCF
jgi:hypothetical protein